MDAIHRVSETMITITRHIFKKIGFSRIVKTAKQGKIRRKRLRKQKGENSEAIGMRLDCTSEWETELLQSKDPHVPRQLAFGTYWFMAYTFSLSVNPNLSHKRGKRMKSNASQYGLVPIWLTQYPCFSNKCRSTSCTSNLSVFSLIPII